jgi:hypothetical protein
MKGSCVNKVLTSIILIPCLFIGACKNVGTTGRTVLRVRSLASVPRSEEEFVSIFRKAATSRQLDSIVRNRERFTRAGAELLNSRQHLLNLLEDDTSDIVLLAGHNYGGNFMFPDGSHVPFSEISNSTRVNRIVVLISCNSDKPDQIGISRVIEYDEANMILDRMLKQLNLRTDLDTSSQNYSYTVGEVERMLQDADQRAYVYYTVSKSTPYVAAGGGLITYFIVKPQIR